MSAASRLVLGTAQLGLDYGVSNLSGRFGEADARALVDHCRANGVDWFDTAPAYGDAETRLGGLLGDEGHVVTKLRIGEVHAADAVRRSLESSLAALRRPRVEALLAHDADELLGPRGDAMWAAMESARREGLVRSIGASVYSGAQVDALLDRFDLDLVQLPMNALDDRLVRGGQLDRLAAASVEVHVRSVFLQGALLADALPGFLAPLATPLAALNAAAQAHGLTRLAALIASVLSRPAVSRIVVGVTSPAEWAAIVDALDAAERSDFTPPPPEISDERLLDPSQWAHLARGPRP